MPGDRTLLLLYPGCIAYETMLAAELLHEHAPIEVATPDGMAHIATSGLRIAAALAWSDIDPGRYRAVLLPGGDVKVAFEDETLHASLRALHDAGAFVAAMCAAPLVLSAAGLLDGRRFTHGFKTWHRDFLAPHWEKGTLVEDLCVRDGQIITAMAEGHVDFAIELLAALDLYDEARREKKRAFYKGVVQEAEPEPIGH